MLERPLSPPEDEAAYRQHHLASDANQSILLAILAILGCCAFVWNDWVLLGHTTTFWGLLPVRLVVVLVSLGCIATLLRTKDPRVFDRVVVTFVLTLKVATLYIVSIHPPDYLGLDFSILLTINALYLAVPGPLSARIFGAIGLSGISILFKGHMPRMLPCDPALLMAHGLAHGVGIPLSMRMARLRRSQFQAQLAEKRVRLQLEAEKERAETLARAKSTFLTTMSHEFRTPMNAVLGLSEVLIHSNLPQEQHDIAKTIHKNADGLLVLLNDILDHAKIDAGHMTVDPGPVDIRELAEGALATVRYRATEKHLRLEFNCTPDIPRNIRGDSARLRQILVNLLSNAVKFTDVGHIRLTVDCRHVGDDQYDVRLVVEDTGIGIAQENLERIFSPFEQANSTLPEGRGGTGLGLSIARNLAQMMGGTLEVKSELGQGSRFEFAFLTTETKSSATQGSRPSLPGVTRRELRILIAEDDETNQRVALAMLAKLGEKADVVNNGQLAVDKLNHTAYDVILMDRHMPVIDGIEAARRIRASSMPTEQPIIIAMTASAFAEDRASCLEAGMDDFISKPVRLVDLRRVLDRARQQGRTIILPLEKEGGVEPVGEIVPTFDPAPFAQLRDLAMLGEPGFLENLYQDFVRDSEHRLTQLSQWLEAGDAKTLEREAHSMKSASASLGALRVASICAQIEKLAREGALADCAPLFPQVRNEFAKARVEIERELKNSAPISVI